LQADLLSEEKLAEFNEAFDAFDKKKESKIPSSDLITVFQAMKCNLSKKEEQEFLSVRASRAPAHAMAMNAVCLLRTIRHE
jgi:Ca2+-binding EF-hand superfamily protein